VLADTMVFSRRGVRHLVAEMGVSQVVFGTDIPFNWPVNVDLVVDSKSLSNADKEAILGGNLVSCSSFRHCRRRTPMANRRDFIKTGRRRAAGAAVSAAACQRAGACCPAQCSIAGKRITRHRRALPLGIARPPKS
jgi:hypothetical protein